MFEVGSQSHFITRAKHPQRMSKYPVNDGINFNGINFPTRVKN